MATEITPHGAPEGGDEAHVRTRAEVWREARRGVGGRYGCQCRVRGWILGAVRVSRAGRVDVGQVGEGGQMGEGLGSW